jgi:hypothetical protein
MNEAIDERDGAGGVGLGGTSPQLLRSRCAGAGLPASGQAGAGRNSRLITGAVGDSPFGFQNARAQCYHSRRLLIIGECRLNSARRSYAEELKYVAHIK